MMFKHEPRKTKPTINHIAKESFRVYRFIEQIHRVRGRRTRFGTVNPWVTYKGHYLNRAYTVEGQFYECLTYNKPSTAVLETSLTKWGNSKGKVTALNTELNKLLNEGWILGSKIKPQIEYNYTPEPEKKDPWIPSELTRIKNIETIQKVLGKQNLTVTPEGEVKLTPHQEELKRALEFQKRELEKFEQGKKRKPKDERH